MFQKLYEELFKSELLNTCIQVDQDILNNDLDEQQKQKSKVNLLKQIYQTVQDLSKFQEQIYKNCDKTQNEEQYLLNYHQFSDIKQKYYSQCTNLMLNYQELQKYKEQLKTTEKQLQQSNNQLTLLQTRNNTVEKQYKLAMVKVQQYETQVKFVQETLDFEKHQFQVLNKQNTDEIEQLKQKHQQYIDKSKKFFDDQQYDNLKEIKLLQHKNNQNVEQLNHKLEQVQQTNTQKQQELLELKQQYKTDIDNCKSQIYQLQDNIYILKSNANEKRNLYAKQIDTATKKVIFLESQLQTLQQQKVCNLTKDEAERKTFDQANVTTQVMIKELKHTINNKQVMIDQIMSCNAQLGQKVKDQENTIRVLQQEGSVFHKDMTQQEIVDMRKINFEQQEQIKYLKIKIEQLEKENQEMNKFIQNASLDLLYKNVQKNSQLQIKQKPNNSLLVNQRQNDDKRSEHSSPKRQIVENQAQIQQYIFQNQNQQNTSPAQNKTTKYNLLDTMNQIKKQQELFNILDQQNRQQYNNDGDSQPICKPVTELHRIRSSKPNQQIKSPAKINQSKSAASYKFLDQFNKNLTYNQIK